MKRKRSFPWLQIAVHLIGWLPLGKIIFDYATNNLTINPIQEIEQRLGLIGLYFLMASLAVTPLYTLTGWRALTPRRRALGLYAFLYTSLHILIFLGLDYGFDFTQIIPLVFGKVYLIIGLIGFSLLVPLAVTSFDYFIRSMGRDWKRLHWLVYPAGLVVVFHYAFSLKGDLLHLRGNELQPFLWGLLNILLLVMRISPVRRWISSTRRKVLSFRFHRMEAHPHPKGPEG